MTQQPTQPDPPGQAVHYSPDGRYRWDGTRWQALELSPDGRYVWTGQRWLPLPTITNVQHRPAAQVRPSGHPDAAAQPKKSEWGVVALMTTVLVVAGLLLYGCTQLLSSGPCEQYDLHYRQHQGGGSFEDQLDGQRLLQRCIDSGGDPLTGEDR